VGAVDTYSVQAALNNDGETNSKQLKELKSGNCIRTTMSVETQKSNRQSPFTLFKRRSGSMMTSLWPIKLQEIIRHN
jgi:hypothetical protein